MNHNCLSCNEPLENKFCANCGQKASTHRYSLKHFIMHDFVHGVFHLDKGFFFTVKELFLRPGHSIREYVQGNRVKHFNSFTFVILIITISHVVSGFSDIKLVDILTLSDNKSNTLEFTTFKKEFPKLYTLIQIPFFALLTYITFGKSKQNLTENLVLNIYKASADLLLLTTISFFTFFVSSPFALNFLTYTLTIITVLYSIWFYYQYFSVFDYSKTGLLFRSLIASIFLIILIDIITSFMVGMKAGFDGH